MLTRLLGNTTLMPAIAHQSKPFPASPHFPCPESLNPKFTVSTAAAKTATTSLNSNEKKASMLYQVLRVGETASPAEIKAAYRKLIKLYHPDANASHQNGKYFIEIQNAYATLSDPVARARYDWSASVDAAHKKCRPFGSKTDNKFRPPTKRWETDQCW